MPKITKATAAARERAFQKLAKAYLEGVTQPTGGMPDEGRGFTEGAREFYLANLHLTYDRMADTKVGKIGLTAYEGWIAGRLPPPPDGRPMQQTFVGGTYRNDYTGKWNWHFDFMVTTPEQALDAFKRGFESILAQ